MPRDLPTRYPGPHYSQLAPNQLGRDGIPIAHPPSFGFTRRGSSQAVDWHLDQATYEWARGHDYSATRENWDAYPGWQNIREYVATRPEFAETLDWLAIFNYQLWTLHGGGTAVTPFNLPEPVAVQLPSSQPAAQPGPQPLAQPAPAQQPAAAPHPSGIDGRALGLVALALLALLAIGRRK